MIWFEARKSKSLHSRTLRDLLLVWVTKKVFVTGIEQNFVISKQSKVSQAGKSDQNNLLIYQTVVRVQVWFLIAMAKLVCCLAPASGCQRREVLKKKHSPTTNSWEIWGTVLFSLPNVVLPDSVPPHYFIWSFLAVQQDWIELC